MPDKEDVRKRLQQVMVEYDCNPTKLAGIYKVNQKTLNNHINGNVEVSVSTILLVLDAFPDLSADWLLRGKGDMHLLPGSLDDPQDQEIGRLESTVETLLNRIVGYKARINELEQMVGIKKAM
jgi:plasmid maintenance system antidote protein VapI